MTSSTARTVANVVLVSAGVAAAVVVITTPPLRRLAIRGLRLWLAASVPALANEVKQAWAQSAPPSAMARGRPERAEGLSA